MRSADQIELSGTIPTAEKRARVSPVVLDAAEALARMHKKRRKVIDLEAPLNTSEGVHTLPNWAETDLIKIMPHRDYRVLFPRGISAHDVSFGLAELRTPTGIKTVAVAIKPFNEKENGPEKNANNAMKDATANAWVLRRGFTTTDPIAVIRCQDSFIVSPVKPGVQALDTEPWHQFATTDDLHVRDHFIGRLRQVGEILASLNFHGINQVDSQLRNYWKTPEGTMEPFDWESARIVGDPPSGDQLLQIGAETLRALLKNLEQGNKSQGANSVPIIRGDTESIWDQFCLYVVEPYVGKLEDLFLESGNDELLAKVTLNSVKSTLWNDLGKRV